MVILGGATVVAVRVAGSLLPASLTAVTWTGTDCPSPSPVSFTDVPPPVTSVDRPPALTTYLVIGRPFSGGAVQVTLIAPASVATVVASRFSTRPGLVNGTTVLLIADAFDPAPCSLTATTENAYCRPYSRSPSLTVSDVPSAVPAGALAPSEIAVTVYLSIF